MITAIRSTFRGQNRRSLTAFTLAGILALVGLTAVELIEHGALALGVLHATILFLLVSRSLSATAHDRLNAADKVTLLRALLAGLALALAVSAFASGTPSWALVAVAAVALALDGVDGFMARRSRSASVFGARFDMESDAFLVLVLGIYGASVVGPIALLISANRYVYALLCKMIPWMQVVAPPTNAGRAIAVLQGLVLLLIATHLLPYWVAVTAVLITFLALCWSFSHSIRWAWARRA